MHSCPSSAACWSSDRLTYLEIWLKITYDMRKVTVRVQGSASKGYEGHQHGDSSACAPNHIICDLSSTDNSRKYVL
jgi:hypothetical protein